MTGGRHARRAALPPAGFARDRQPGPGSLAVTVAGESGGTEGVFDFSALPGPPALLAACAAGFARMAGPDRPWRAAATCANGYKAIRELLRWAADLDPPPQVPEHITPAVWAQWRLSRPGTVYGRACQLAVRQWLPQVPGIPADHRGLRPGGGLDLPEFLARVGGLAGGGACRDAPGTPLAAAIPRNPCPRAARAARASMSPITAAP